MSVSEPPDVKELVALARRFAERKLFEEAAELFGVALRLEPRKLGTRLALARIRRLQKAQGRIAAKDPVETARSEMRRNGIDASHFVGLAWLYAEKGEEFRALEGLHIASRAAVESCNLASTVSLACVGARESACRTDDAHKSLPASAAAAVVYLRKCSR